MVLMENSSCSWLLSETLSSCEGRRSGFLSLGIVRGGGRDKKENRRCACSSVGRVVSPWGSPSCPDESTGRLNPLELLKWRKEFWRTTVTQRKSLTLQVGSGGEVTPHPGPSRSVQPSQPVTLEISVVVAMKGSRGLRVALFRASSSCVRRTWVFPWFPTAECKD